MEHIPLIFTEGKCLYCRQEIDIDYWHSCWSEDGQHHYKILSCPSCMRENWLKVDFPGSGHDAVLKKNRPPLESVLRRVPEK